LTSDDVARLRSSVLEAHAVSDPVQEGWGEVVEPPRFVEVEVPGGAPTGVWMLLSGNEYLVFYDPESGDCGLAANAQDGRPTYIGDYGSLWCTLRSM
jgi:hypothetical protein